MTDTEKLIELTSLIKDMRDAKKAYFKSKQKSELKISKAKERMIDEWIKNNGDTVSKLQTGYIPWDGDENEEDPVFGLKYSKRHLLYPSAPPPTDREGLK